MVHIVRAEYWCKLCPDCGVVSMDGFAKLGLWMHYLHTYGRPTFISLKTMEGTIWCIPATVLPAGIKIFDKNPEQIKEVLDAASSRKEFLALAAIV